MSPEVQPPQNTIPAGATSRNEDEATVPFTTLKTHLKDHFTAVLQRTKPAHMRQKGQVKPNEYGEVLTADKVFECIHLDGKVHAIPFKCVLLCTHITRAQRVIAYALCAINLHVRVDCT